jgi:hypothetical protein
MKAAQKKVTIPESEQVRIEATQTLVERLGVTKAALFIRDNLSQKTDYIAMKEQLFGKMSVDEAFEQTRETTEEADS